MIRIRGYDHPVWPEHPRPLPDELLSSWMTRLARANHFKVYPFYAQYFGRDRQIWNRDIDGLAPDWLMEGLASWTRQEQQEVEQTTLRSFEGLLYEHENPHGRTKWILPAGIYHRTRRRHWLVYCPLCLFWDEEPFFRKSWRLAFNTVCERHGSKMLDACPKCEAPVVFFRRDLGHRHVAMVDSLALCYRCGFDLRRAPAFDPPAPDGETLMQLRSLIAFHDLGWWFNGKATHNYSMAFLDVLHHLASFLTSRFGRQLLAQAERSMSWPEPDGLALKHMALEYRPIEERHRLLMVALWLLQGWPDRFVGLCKAVGLTRSRIVQEAKLPYWFESVLREHLDKSIYHPSEEEVRQAVIHLARDEEVVSRDAIGRLIGGGDTKATRPYAHHQLTFLSEEECERIERALLARLECLKPGGSRRFIAERNLAIVRMMRATGWPLQRTLGLTKEEVVSLVEGSVPDGADPDAWRNASDVLRDYLEKVGSQPPGRPAGGLVFTSWRGKRVPVWVVCKAFSGVTVDDLVS